MTDPNDVLDAAREAFWNVVIEHYGTEGQLTDIEQDAFNFATGAAVEQWLPGEESGMSLELNIQTGNEAMLTPEDMAHALRRVANTLENLAPTSVFGGPILDRNGNQVGHYQGAGEPRQ